MSYEANEDFYKFSLNKANEEKDKIWQLLNVEENTGISLTENRAMYPAASVCGWYFSHSESRYFSVSKIDL